MLQIVEQKGDTRGERDGTIHATVAMSDQGAGDFDPAVHAPWSVKRTWGPIFVVPRGGPWHVDARAIGDRLRANGRYAPLLEEMPRYWRLSYANEFHLDTTPSIVEPACASGGEPVPDRLSGNGRQEWV